MEEAEEVVEECKVAIMEAKVVRTSRAISKTRTTITRPSNANSLRVVEIVLMGTSVLSRTDLLSFK